MRSETVTLSLVGLVLAIATVTTATQELRFTPPSAAALPTACVVGDLATKTGEDAGLYVCTGTDTWTALPGDGSGAPTTVTYLTQTASGSLSAEQALSSLSTGLLKVTTTTGVLSTAEAADVPDLSGTYLTPAAADLAYAPLGSVTESGTACTITAITNGLITAATCTP